jgi:hypothetical protein
MWTSHIFCLCNVLRCCQGIYYMDIIFYAQNHVFKICVIQYIILFKNIYSGFSLRRPGFDPRLGNVEFMVDKMTLG